MVKRTVKITSTKFNLYSKFANTRKQNTQIQTKSYDYKNLFSIMPSNNLIFMGRAPEPVYAIDYWGNCQKFDSIASASKSLNISKSVYSTLSGHVATACGYVFVKAKDIEIDKKNETELNKKVLCSAINNFAFSIPIPIYAIGKNGEIQRYNSSNDAIALIGCNPKNISKVTMAENKTCGDYVFVKAFDVELRNEWGKVLFDESGKPKLDMKKINKARENFLYGNNTPIVAIFENGEIKLYNTRKDVIEQTGIKERTLQRNISNGSRNKTYACRFVKIVDVVKRDKEGNILFDNQGQPEIDQGLIFKLKNIVSCN